MVRVLVIRVVRNDSGLIAADLSCEVDGGIRVVSNRYLSPKTQILQAGYELVYSSLRTISLNKVLDSFNAGEFLGQCEGYDGPPVLNIGTWLISVRAFDPMPIMVFLDAACEFGIYSLLFRY